MTDSSPPSQASPTASEARCPCCSEALQGKFCGTCGQRAGLGRLRTWGIIGGAFAAIIDVERAVPRTVLGLTTKPGVVCREYVDGKRAKYANPFKYALITLALLVLAASWKQAIVFRDMKLTFGGPGDLTARQMEAEAISLVSQNLNIAIFLAMPVCAAMLLGLFRRGRLNYAEHFTFVLYMSGHFALVRAVFVLAGLMGTNAGFFASLLGELAYFIWAGVQFYGRSWMATAWRMVIAQGVYRLTTIAIAAGIALGIMFWLPESLGGMGYDWSETIERAKASVEAAAEAQAQGEEAETGGAEEAPPMTSP